MKKQNNKKTSQPKKFRNLTTTAKVRRISQCTLLIMAITIATLLFTVGFTTEDSDILHASQTWNDTYNVKDITEGEYTSILHYEGSWKVDFNNKWIILCDDSSFSENPKWVSDGLKAVKDGDNSEQALFAAKFTVDADNLGCTKPCIALGTALFTKSDEHSEEELTAIRNYMVMYLSGVYSPYDDLAE